MMMKLKYELTNESKVVNGRTLYRIRALQSFVTVRAGDLGGWVASEANLSHDGTCWIHDNAHVFDNASVSGYAHVFDNANVFGNAHVYRHASVSDNAWVYDNAHVFDNASVSGYAHVFGYANVSGNVHVFDNANVFGNAHMFGNASVSGNANVSASDDFLAIGPIGSKGDTITLFRTSEGCVVTTGCFSGSIDEFIAAVKSTHRGSTYEEEYMSVIPLFRVKENSWK